MWEVTQGLIAQGRISAGHDISDGGLATTLLEMAFAGGQESVPGHLVHTLVRPLSPYRPSYSIP